MENENFVVEENGGSHGNHMLVLGRIYQDLVYINERLKRLEDKYNKY